jgi:GNAT superfamily N-acetyltransferase
MNMQELQVIDVESNTCPVGDIDSDTRTPLTTATDGSKYFTTRLARVEDDIPLIATILNQAYKVGEQGILDDSPKFPLVRAKESEVRDMIQAQQMIILLESQTSSTNNDHSCTKLKTILGCVRAFVVDHACTDDRRQNSDYTGEWGCLAIELSHQGRGLGRMLVNAAEQHLHEQSCRFLRIDLLAPSSGDHAHKERLRTWYTKRLGYNLSVPGDYAASTKKLSARSLLAGRFLLANDTDYTCYRERISIDCEVKNGPIHDRHSA